MNYQTCYLSIENMELNLEFKQYWITNNIYLYFWD